MSLNKFMHPRNKYKKPPDFKSLAIKYPEFRKFAKQEITGKVSLDFKNVEAIRALTCTLLKEDFDLDVEIPVTRLVPTLPLRLNYLLWLEDILEMNQRADLPVKGIDIGCGASCVYPLLAAKSFGWQMLATEVDTESAFIASNNVKRNNLQNMIKVKCVDEKAMLSGVLDADTAYDVSMCNPPFFSSLDELEPANVSRNVSRPPPRNAHSGAPCELVTDGGELAFISRMIDDSVKLQRLVRIYTVMVGHKSSVNKVKKSLETAGISKVSTTEFCQGRTTRWGVAWTLDDTIKLPQVTNVPLTNKKKVPFNFSSDMDLDLVVTRLKELMNQLQITYSILKSNQEMCAMEINAKTNTWSNSRKKRRQEKFRQNQSTDMSGKNEQNSLESSQSAETNCNGSKTEINHQVDDSENLTNDKKRKISDDDELPGCSDTNSKKFKADDANKELLLIGSLVVKRISKGSTIDLFWLRGSGGRDAAHQILQHFKNNLKIH